MINKRLLHTFLELVKIDSPSGDEMNLANKVLNKLKSLKVNAFKDTYGNVIGKLNGQGNPLFLNTHLDTVEPGRNITPIIKDGKVITDGTTVLGADPKAGIAIILESIQSIVEEKKNRPPLEIVFTREEETTFGGSINLDYSQLTAKHGIVFDGDEEVNNIFVSSPTLWTIDGEIIGRGAHAGVAPEKGISAIEISAKIINKFKLGRLDEETTCNIGLITGGTVRNAVPEKVTFAGEIRSRNSLTLQNVIAELKAVADKIASLYPEAKITMTFTKDSEGFVIFNKNKLIKKASAVLGKMNLSTKLKNSGGASDANVFFTKGIQTIVMGTGVYEPHTTKEYLVISQMVTAAQFGEKFILASV